MIEGKGLARRECILGPLEVGLGSYIHDVPKEREEWWWWCRQWPTHVRILSFLKLNALGSANTVGPRGDINSKELWNPIHTEDTSTYSGVLATM